MKNDFFKLKHMTNHKNWPTAKPLAVGLSAVKIISVYLGFTFISHLVGFLQGTCSVLFTAPASVINVRLINAWNTVVAL